MPGVKVDKLERMTKIISLVAESFMLTPELIRSNNTRKRNVIMAKQMAIKLIRMHYKVPVRYIGLLFNCHYSSIIHHCRKVDDLRYSDEEYDKIYLNLESLAILL